jgi:ATP-dependent helicase/nuclease subunit A
LQDVPLLGVLHSFAGGFKESELAEIKFGRKHQLLYDALVAYREEGEDRDLREKTAEFLDRLDAYRNLSGRTGVYELLLHITEKEEIYDHFRSMRLGEVRIANLNLLLEKARDYSATGYSGIFTFLQYIESMKKKEIDFGEANLLDENADVVRIFTMHKSKGLEFPVCFLLGMGEDLTKSADRKELAIETGVGMGMDYVDSEKRVKHRTLSKNMLLYRNKIEQRGEDLRLLYVAMTRAKEKLIMVGCATGKLLENPENDGENRMFRFHEIMKANTYLNILYPEAKRNPELFGLRFFKPEELIDWKDEAECWF